MIARAFIGQLVDVITNISRDDEDENGDVRIVKFAFTSYYKESDEEFLYFSDDDTEIHLAVSRHSIVMLSLSSGGAIPDVGEMELN